MCRYNIRGEPPQSDIDDALSRHEAACLPADSETLAKEVAAMRLSCVSRDISEKDLRAQTEVYVQRLAEWPADAVLAALREWPSRSKWFPAWAELEALIREHCHERLARRKALRRCKRDVGNARYSTADDAKRASERRRGETTDLSAEFARLRQKLSADAGGEETNDDAEAA